MGIELAEHKARIKTMRGAYLTAMAFTNTGDVDEAPAGSQVTGAALEQARADVASFYWAAWAFLSHAEKNGGFSFDVWEHAGHDFWLTRCGHGAGFWDGDWQSDSVNVADILTEKAQSYGEVDLLPEDFA